MIVAGQDLIAHSGPIHAILLARFAPDRYNPIALSVLITHIDKK